MGFFKEIGKFGKNVFKGFQKVATPVLTAAGTAIGGPIGGSVGGIVGNLVSGIGKGGGGGGGQSAMPPIVGITGGQVMGGGAVVKQDGTVMMPGGMRTSPSINQTLDNVNKDFDSRTPVPQHGNSSSNNNLTAVALGLGAVVLLSN